MSDTQKILEEYGNRLKSIPNVQKRLTSNAVRSIGTHLEDTYPQRKFELDNVSI